MDVRYHFENSIRLAADDRPFVCGLRLVGRQTLPDGLTYGHAPTKAHECVPPNFTLMWIEGHWQHWWHGGLPATFVEHEYDAFNGIDRSWLSMDGAMTKAPPAGEKTGLCPVDRGKQGTKRSLLVEAGGVPVGLAVAGANKNRLQLDEAADLWVAIGSDDQSKVWLNDQMIWKSADHYKSWVANEGLRKVHFNKGTNRVLLRLENGQFSGGFSLMVCLDPSVPPPTEARRAGQN